ncbi:hypothetical protein VOLCADRAFT_96320 [Volvox carteri f. nagariensis]|uniref:Uncharacterized protein n=1 Tax=Volvox carteri f. nagariensis TaxID=3068 RepID=D8U9T1_VOLCA|nr:uncharacterized protein VOLCADRAFT_96320 [Volvox carteri f. nagariensis]EFJ43525.1 hypothetical protein VOLCADRAFT_96320 [Volvox carteri f. nagariensis]|eukprot:XP_002955454.1 hypothetical protein VOLCADRAFT_96320 [Volvox carteri f. nagariensis]
MYKTQESRANVGFRTARAMECPRPGAIFLSPRAPGLPSSFGLVLKENYRYQHEDSPGSISGHDDELLATQRTKRNGTERMVRRHQERVEQRDAGATAVGSPIVYQTNRAEPSGWQLPLTVPVDVRLRSEARADRHLQFKKAAKARLEAAVAAKEAREAEATRLYRQTLTVFKARPMPDFWGDGGEGKKQGKARAGKRPTQNVSSSPAHKRSRAH